MCLFRFLKLSGGKTVTPKPSELQESEESGQYLAPQNRKNAYKVGENKSERESHILPALLTSQFAAARDNTVNYDSDKAIKMKRPATNNSGTCIRINHNDFMIISSRSWGRLAWDFLTFSLVVFIALIVPLRLGFGIAEGSSIWKLFDRIVDVVFIADVCLNFVTTYSDKNGEEIKDHKAIIKHYLKTWFLLDFVSSIPFGWILEGSTTAQYTKTARVAKVGQASKVIKAVRALKLTKLVRLFKASKFASYLASFFILTRVQGSIVRIVSLTLILAHLCACIFSFIGRFEEDELHASWLSAYDLHQAGPGDQYIAALYFCVGSITTVGYGDIVPVNTGERAFVLCLMIIGSGYYGYIVASMGQLLESWDVHLTEYRRKADVLTAYMKRKRFPRKLYHKVKSEHRRYFHKLSAIDNDFDVNEGLTPALKREVTVFILTTPVAKQLRSIDLFQKLSNESILKLLDSIRQISINSGEYIVSKGEVGESMYVLVKGKLRISKQIENTLKGENVGYLYYNTGAYFGESVALGLGNRYEISVMAVEFSELFQISRNAFNCLFDSMENDNIFKSMVSVVTSESDIG